MASKAKLTTALAMPSVLSTAPQPAKALRTSLAGRSHAQQHHTACGNGGHLVQRQLLAARQGKIPCFTA
jgi:hypothetical protein